MNHKVLASLVSLGIACPITLLGWTELENAVADGAKMKMTFVVVDNDNNVVSNAWIQGERARGRTPLVVRQESLAELIS